MKLGSGRPLGAVVAWSDERPYIGQRAVPAAAVAVAAVLAVTLSSYWATLGVQAATATLLALSVGLVFNRAGMLALCPYSFAGLGAWVAGWLTVEHRLPFLVAMLVAGCLAVPAGLLVGALSLRLREMNLAIATVALAAVTPTLLTIFPIPGQNQGRQISPPRFAGSEWAYFLLCLAVVTLIGVVVTAALHRRPGATWMMLRSERATAAAGANVLVAKLSVFAVSAAIAAVAGVLLAAQSGIVEPSSFGLSQSLGVAVVAVLVGAGRMEGAVFAGIIGAFSSQLLLLLGISANIANIFFGVAVVQILVKGDQGVAGQAQARRTARRTKRREAPASTTPADAFRDRAPGRAEVVEPTLAPAPSQNGARPTVFEVSGLTVVYGSVKALDDVSLAVPEGTVAGLIGPNGAGKTTLLDAASGFVPTVGGSVRLDGRDLGGLAPHRRARAGLRRTFQQSRVVGELTVASYLRFVAGPALTADTAAAVLELFDCPAPNRVLGTLDVPARRRVEVAAAIAAGPRIVLLDEPAAGLAEQESAALARALSEIPRSFGVSVLVIEHDIEVVQAACSLVTVLDYGRVLACGAPQQVLSTDEVQLAYLGVGGEP